MDKRHEILGVLEAAANKLESMEYRLPKLQTGRQTSKSKDKRSDKGGRIRTRNLFLHEPGSYLGTSGGVVPKLEALLYKHLLEQVFVSGQPLSVWAN